MNCIFKSRLVNYIPNESNEILWGNHKSGMKYVKHMIEDGEFITVELYDKLVFKARYIFEILTIRRCSPAEWLRVGHSGDMDVVEGNSILNTMFQIRGWTRGWRRKLLCFLTAEEKYKIWLNSADMNMRSNEYWSNRMKKTYSLY